MKQIKSKEIIVITGMRRVGKTTMLQYVFDKIPSNNKVLLDIDNPISRIVFEEQDYNNIWENLKKYGITKKKKAYLFLDEIQAMPEIVKAVKYLYDHYNIKFFLTGSSSYYLKNLFPESLAGRKIIFEMYPLTFQEFLVFREKAKTFHDTLTKKAKHKNKISFELHKKLYEEYLEWGGFPEVVLESDNSQKRLKINDVFKSYFEQDVKGLADFGNIGKVRDLILLLLQRICTKIDISKLASELGVSRPTLYSYLSFLEATYFIHLLSPFSRNVDREISGSNKVFICDTGLIIILAKASYGSILENSAFQNIRHFKKINYYEKRKGGEIDFIVDEKTALEVKTKAVPQDIHRLKKLSKTLDIHKYYVVSKEFVDHDKAILAQDL